MNRIVTELIDMTHPDSPAPGCELLPLCDAREHAPQLAAWHAAEWAHLYEGWDAAVALRDLLSEPADGSLPMTLIARDGDRLLGSVSLIMDDLPGWSHCNPWLASFYVAPQYRKRGIGAALVRAALQRLDASAGSRVYLFTESAADYFAGHGFTFFGSGVAGGFEVTVMSRAIAAQDASST